MLRLRLSKRIPLLRPHLTSHNHTLHPLQPQPVHLHRQLKQIIQTLTLRFRLLDILAPNIDPMPLDQHRTRLGPLLNRLLQRILQVLLVRSILDNRDLHRVEVAQVACFAPALEDLRAARAAARDAFDLLDLFHGEDVGAVGVLVAGFADEGYEDGPLGVRMDTAAGAALGEGCHEEGGAGGGFERLP